MINCKCYCCNEKATIYVIVAELKIALCANHRNAYKIARKVVRDIK